MLTRIQSRPLTFPIQLKKKNTVVSMAFSSFYEILEPWSSRWLTDFISHFPFSRAWRSFPYWQRMKIWLLGTLKRRKARIKIVPQGRAILKLISKLNWPLIHLNRNILSWCLEFWWIIISLATAWLICKGRRIMTLHKTICGSRNQRPTDGRTKKR